MMDRFSQFADDVNTIKRFAGDAKYLYKFGKNFLKGGYEGAKNIYDTVFRRSSYNNMNKAVDDYLRTFNKFHVCWTNVYPEGHT